MKRAMIIGLLSLNLALIALLVWGPTRSAQAQTFRSTDYLMYTVRSGLTTETVVVVDLAQRKMVGWQLSAARGGQWKWTRLRGSRDLKRDYRRTGQ